jgi:pentatricopeptide repeat protein
MIRFFFPGWILLLSVCHKNELYTRSNKVEIGLPILQVFKSMSGAKSKHKPHVRTYNSLMCNYARAGQVEQMEGSLSRMISAGFKPTVITYDILISGYGRAGSFDKMTDCFQQLLDAKIRPEVSTLNSMIAAYCDHKLYEEAEKLLKDARQFRVNPQASSYSILLR